VKRRVASRGEEEERFRPQDCWQEGRESVAGIFDREKTTDRLTLCDRYLRSKTPARRHHGVSLPRAELGRNYFLHLTTAARIVPVSNYSIKCKARESSRRLVIINNSLCTSPLSIHRS